MTDQTPIGRAARALLAAASSNPELPIEVIARTAFDSIDVDQLAGVLRSQILGENTLAHSVRLEIAHTVKNWLTGKDQE